MKTKYSSGNDFDPVFLRLKNEFSAELNNILEFWSSSCVDEKYGGFIGTMDHFGKIVPEASKGLRGLLSHTSAPRDKILPKYVS